MVKKIISMLLITALLLCSLCFVGCGKDPEPVEPEATVEPEVVEPTEEPEGPVEPTAEPTEENPVEG